MVASKKRKQSLSMIHSEIPEVYPQLPEGNGVPGTALYQKQKTSQSLILPYFHPFSNPTFFFLVVQSFDLKL